MKSIKALFFIVGAQRSGSTLLRLILNAHSRIAVPEEGRFLQPLIKKCNMERPIKGAELQNLIEYLKANPFYKNWNYDNTEVLRELSSISDITIKEFIRKLYVSFANFEGKDMWGDKSLFLKIDVLHEFFPEAKFIHIVRDGRDVFDSWRKIDPTKGNVAVTALDWRLKTGIIEKAFSRIPPDQNNTLKYESLLENPEDEVSKVCSFLKVDFEPTMFDYYRSSNKYVGKHHSQLIFKPLDSRNYNKWKTQLTSIELGVYELIAGPVLKRYGYETGYGAPVPVSAFYGAIKFAFGLPAKVASMAKVRLITRKAMKTGGDIAGLTVGEMPERERGTNRAI